MPLGLVLIAVSLPLLELAVIIKVGQWIGIVWTLLLLLGTMLAGGIIIHEQGFNAMRRMLDAARSGRAPLEPAIDSAFLMLAGVLFLFPGFLTDIAGALLLIPPIRRMFALWIWRRMVASGSVHVETRTAHQDGPAPFRRGPPDGDPRAGQGKRSGDGVVIEGEWERVDDPPGSGKPRDKR